MADLSTQIKDVLKKAELPEGLAGQIKVEKEEDITPAVEKLKTSFGALKDLTGEDFLEVIKIAGLSDPLLKHVQSESDRRVSEAMKTRDLKDKTILDEENTKLSDEEKRKKEEGMTAEQKEVASLREENKEIKETLNTILKNTSEKDMSTLVKAGLKEVGLDEGFEEFIKVKSPEEIGDAVKKLSEKFGTEHQQKIDEKLEKLGLPKTGQVQSASEMEKTMSDYAKNKNVGEQTTGLLTDKLSEMNQKKE